MFLNESIESTGLVSNETSMYEAILEANNAYHSLCLQAVKYEHQAIVSEDAQLLREAEEGFMTKLKNIAKTLYQKFISFINRVKAEWSKLYASVITKLGYNSGATRHALDKVSEIEVEVKVVDIAAVGKKLEGLMEKAGQRAGFNTDALKGLDGKDFEGGYKAGQEFAQGASKNSVLMELVRGLKDLDKFFGKDSNFKGKKQKINRARIMDAVNFLEERPKMIKMLEHIRSVGAEAYKATVTAIDNETMKSTEGMIIAKFTTIINKIITRVNYLTTDAVKIARAAAKVSGPKNKDVEKFEGQIKRAIYK
jgi:hypothetical protein